MSDPSSMFDPATPMRRFEHVDEAAVRRFWHVGLDGRRVLLFWGLTGTRGSRLVKELPSDGKAKAEHDRLIRQRLGMGFVEVEGDRDPAPPR